MRSDRAIFSCHAGCSDYACKGGLVIGICNGFQILCESHLLPGALVRNENLQFICKQVYLRCENSFTAFTSSMEMRSVIKIPVAHGEGKYVCDEQTLTNLNSKNQIVFRYCDLQGEVTNNSNPNGSMYNIAGITSAEGNVLGMMPHPERAIDSRSGSDNGRAIFESLLRASVKLLSQ